MTYENLAILGVRFAATLLLFIQVVSLVVTSLVLAVGGQRAPMAGSVFSSAILYIGVSVLAFRLSRPIGRWIARGL